MNLSIHKNARKSDTGALVVQQMIAMAVGFVIVALGITATVVYLNNSRDSRAMQAAESSISRTLDVVDNSVDTSDKALYASPKDLVLQKTDAGKTTLTRWVITGGKFYQQQWDDFAGTYKHSTAWIPVATKDAVAPNGSGRQVTVTMASNLDSSNARLEFFDTKGSPLALSSEDPAVLSNIAQVGTFLEGTITDEGQGKLVNKKISVLGGQKLPAGVVIADPFDVPEPTAVPTPTSGTPVTPSGTPVTPTSPTTSGAPTSSPAPSGSSTATPKPTASPSPTMTSTAVPSPSKSATPAPTPTPTKTATPTPAPVKKTLICAKPNVTLTSGKLVLKWSAVSGATSYKVTRDGITVSTVKTLTYTDATNVKAKHTYKVIPAAADAISPTNCTTVTFTPAAPAPVPVMSCTVPTVKLSSGVVAVSWSAVKGATKYTVVRDGVTAGTTSTGVLSFRDTKANAKVAHTYKVIPSGAGYTTPASCSSVNYKPGILSCPAAPAAKKVGSQVVITWSKVTGATGYTVMRGSTQVGTTTALKFTDTGAKATSQYSYRLIPTAAGMISPSCATFAYLPPLVAPKFYSSNVGVTGEWPTSWDGSTQTPVITMKWNAVSRAKSYKLEYRVMNYSGTKVVKNWAIATTTTGLTYQMSKASFNELYQWRVTAVVGSETAVSSTIDMLTHPLAATNLGTKAQYVNVSAGKNLVTWNASTGAAGYHVYKVVSGKHSFIATLAGGTITSYTHTGVAYGSTVEYWVAPYNNGRRGVDANGAVVTGKRSAPAPSKSTVQRTLIKKQLQFPATPSVKKVNSSSLAAGSQDLDLKNVIRWNSVPTATKYQVERKNFDRKDVRCLTNKDCESTTSTQGTSTAFTDSAVKTGSQYRYSVLAVNATGLSYQSSQEVVLTQRPAKPAVKALRTPSLSSKVFEYAITTNADAGTPGFCTPSTCEVVGSESVAKASSTAKRTVTVDFTKSGAAVTIGSLSGSDSSATWGDTITTGVVSKNGATYNGGKSAAASITFKEYPGAFSIASNRGNADGDNAYRLRLEQRKYGGDTNADTTWNGSFKNETISNGSGSKDDTYLTSQAGKLYAKWGSSEGAKSKGYVASYTTSNASTSSNSSLMLPTSSEKKGSVTVNSGGQWTLQDVSPGAKYTFNVKVTARSGLTRSASSVEHTRMDTPEEVNFQYLCAHNSPYMRLGGPSPTEDYAKHKVSMKAYSAKAGTRYGIAGKTAVDNFWYRKGDSRNASGWKNVGKSFTSYSSDSGVGYSYRTTHGFFVNTAETGSNLASPTLFFELAQVAQFQAGCAGTGVTNPAKMKEPTDVCYGYAGGICWDRNYRPFMKSK